MRKSSLIVVSFISLLCFKSTMVHSLEDSSLSPIRPWAALNRGDKVAIVAPSRGISAELLEKAKNILLNMGFEPMVEDDTFGENVFNYANTDEKRAKSFNAAMRNDEIKALFAIRGGQGACDVVFHLEKYFSKDMEESWQSKPLVGFSDITALHLLLNSKGIPTIHGPVLSLNRESETQLNGEQNFSDVALFLFNPHDEKIYDRASGVDFTPLNEAASLSTTLSGILTGGNLTGVASSMGTLSEVPENSILVLEDVGETPERVKRSLWQIHRTLSRKQKEPKAIIFGDFKSENPNFIRALEEFASEVSYPVVKTDVIGHGSKNIFLSFGTFVALTLGSEISLRFLSWNS